MTDSNPCENCGCGLADDSIETNEVHLDIGLDFSVMVRRYLEKHTAISDDDRIQQVTICPEEITALVEADPETDGESGA